MIADGECIMNLDRDADAMWTFLGTVFSRPTTSTRRLMTSSRNAPTSVASDMVTTFPTSPRVCPSVPPVNPIPYLLADSRD